MNNNRTEIETVINTDLFKQKFSLKDTIKETLYFSLPLITSIIFICVIVFAVVPQLQEIFTNLDKLDATKVKAQEIEDRKAYLNNLAAQNNTRIEVLKKINELIPTGNTEVVLFAKKIEELASKQFNLQINNISTGEAILSQNASDNNYFDVYQIPTVFKLSGSFENIRNYFKSLYNGQDFFIVEDMNLTSVDSVNWNGNVSLVKYQFNTSSELTQNIYGTISERQVPNTEVISFIKNKYIDNQIFD